MFPPINKEALKKAVDDAKRATVLHITEGRGVVREPLEPECGPDGTLAEPLIQIEASIRMAIAQNPEFAKHPNFLFGVIGTSITYGIRIGIEYERLTREQVHAS